MLPTPQSEQSEFFVLGLIVSPPAPSPPQLLFSLKRKKEGGGIHQFCRKLPDKDI